MDATIESLELSEIDCYREIESLIKKQPPGWQSVCAVIGLAGGVSAPLLGATSGVVTWLVSPGSVNSYLHVLSIVLYALTLPLLIMGASCLDLLEAKTDQASPPPASTPYVGATPAIAIGHVAQQKAHHPLKRTVRV